MTPELGMKLKDPATGVEGTCTAVIHYLGGRVMYCIEYMSDAGAKELWVDVQRIDWKP